MPLKAYKWQWWFLLYYILYAIKIGWFNRYNWFTVLSKSNQMKGNWDRMTSIRWKHVLQIGKTKSKSINHMISTPNLKKTPKFKWVIITLKFMVESETFVCVQAFNRTFTWTYSMIFNKFQFTFATSVIVFLRYI